jgi:hypothetical protein
MINSDDSISWYQDSIQRAGKKDEKLGKKKKKKTIHHAMVVCVSQKGSLRSNHNTQVRISL